MDHYIGDFERVRLPALKHPYEELPLLTGLCQRVIDQHLALLAEHRPSENGKEKCRASS